MAHIEVSTEGHILLININRPEKYNALTPDMYHAMGQALARLNEDPALRVGVISAEGKHFTAGVELNLWSERFASGNAFPVQEGEIDPLGLSGEPHTKPLVIAMQGYCFTWGVELALNCEIRVAASDTQFSMLEVKRGIYPCGGATLRLPRDIGWGNAQRVLLTGDRWSADEAYRWGMVQALAEPGEQFNAAMDIARRIANAAPLAVQACLGSTRFGAVHDKDAAVKEFMAGMSRVMKTEDAAEGLNSFLERRDAVFQGR